MAQMPSLQEGVCRKQGMGLGLLLVPVLPGSKAFWLFLLEFSSDGFFPPATPNCMGLEGGLPCEMVPDRALARVSTASLPFWHHVWDR